MAPYSGRFDLKATCSDVDGGWHGATLETTAGARVYLPILFKR